MASHVPQHFIASYAPARTPPHHIPRRCSVRREDPQIKKQIQKYLKSNDYKSHASTYFSLLLLRGDFISGRLCIVDGREFVSKGKILLQYSSSGGRFSFNREETLFGGRLYIVTPSLQTCMPPGSHAPFCSPLDPGLYT